jgi:phage terminase large subunit-like protein
MPRTTRPSSAQGSRDESRADRVIRFIEKVCKTPEGAHVGKPIVLAPFQKQFIHDTYRDGVRRSYLSIARKNGKTGLIACLLLAHLVGPEAVQNSQIVSGANSRDQAALVFNLAVKMIEQSPELRPLVKIVPSSKRLVGLPMNVEFRALSAEGSTAHGLSPVLAILDEVGQVRGPQSDFIDAITTSQGAHAAPLLIAISTQAAEDGDLFSIWLDDAIAAKDPSTVVHLHAAPKDCALDDENAWRAANPALGIFRSIEDVREQATQAARMPTAENTFRLLTLNQRVHAESPFVTRSVWQANGGRPQSLDGVPVYAGLDLSAVNDLTALVLVGNIEGAWHVDPTFWLPKRGLAEKARLDRVPYDVWASAGYLQTTPSPSVDYSFVAHQLREVFMRYDLRAIAFDRWNFRHLEPHLREVGFDDYELEKFRPFGQGIVSMSPALRTLESALLNEQLRHGDHPVLAWNAANAVCETDAAGNRKFTKRRSTGRIDGMVALAMALAVASEMNDAIVHEAPIVLL